MLSVLFSWLYIYIRYGGWVVETLMSKILIKFIACMYVRTYGTAQRQRRKRMRNFARLVLKLTQDSRL